jgi:negative regulator of flagellin synthesis FlgM
MKISEHHTVVKMLDLHTNRTAKVSADKISPGKSNDRVSLSPQARELMEAQRLLADMPDVREDKVREIKQRIDEGRYRIESETIAAQMIREAFPENE